jgi:DNA-binding transcriptional regulator YiaG
MELGTLVETAQRRRRLPRPEVRRLVREEACVPQRELAAVLGVSRPTATRWENGRRTPHGPLLDRYLAALARLAEVE